VAVAAAGEVAAEATARGLPRVAAKETATAKRTVTIMARQMVTSPVEPPAHRMASRPAPAVAPR